MVDIHPEDAKRLGIRQGDKVRLFSETGQICVKANLTVVSHVGDLHLIHGYEEANASDLISWNALDPYSGFPSYKQVRCGIEKVPEQTDPLPDKDTDIRSKQGKGTEGGIA